jgi:hypothetical protein
VVAGSGSDTELGVVHDGGNSSRRRSSRGGGSGGAAPPRPRVPSGATSYAEGAGGQC